MNQHVPFVILERIKNNALHFELCEKLVGFGHFQTYHIV